jgi:hypothetical protein
MHFVSTLLIALMLNAGLCVAAQAQGQKDAGGPPGGEQGGRPPGPPPEALAACKSLTAGAACNFESPRGAKSGTCFAPEGKPLACRPADHARSPSDAGSGPKRQR